jgi:hypothetical protein
VRPCWKILFGGRAALFGLPGAGRCLIKRCNRSDIFRSYQPFIHIPSNANRCSSLVLRPDEAKT